MRVFGIDCGTEFTGFGVVELDARARHLAARSPRRRNHSPEQKANHPRSASRRSTPSWWRRSKLHAPDVVAIEEVFFSANAKSALKLGQVRGVALLAAATCGKPVAEYAPLSIKSAVVGYGLAAKEQVQFMVTRLLKLEVAPDSADAADALAIAICHLHTAQNDTQNHVQAVLKSRLPALAGARPGARR